MTMTPVAPMFPSRVLRRPAAASRSRDRVDFGAVEVVVNLLPGTRSGGAEHRDRVVFTAGRAGWSLPRAVAVVGVASLAAHLAWLGWDRERTYGPEGTTGPYESWQVLGLALTVAAVVAWAGWRAQPGAAVVTSTLVITSAWSVSAATDPDVEGVNLWPIGAMMLLVSVAAGTSAVAYAAAGVRARRH